ncbi:hypothetical protein M9H77_28369 [Catharanthus roseus]|uniref:Uncharacterized protein n=1 Tax=Catharanthus roseus TaxID=4058 RepID=A0ACC0AFR8_CATRO|nr:hypothetical protein M9H77_28369 [Catharanthus roseus]
MGGFMDRGRCVTHILRDSGVSPSRTSMLHEVDDMTTRRGGGSGGPGHGNLGFDVPSDPFHSLDLDAPTFSLDLTPLAQSHPSGSSISYVPPPSTGGISYAPPPPGTLGLSVLHMPIFYASCSDSNELTDNVTPAQQLGFGHHIGKKTTRFMPSDWR